MVYCREKDKVKTIRNLGRFSVTENYFENRSLQVTTMTLKKRISLLTVINNKTYSAKCLKDFHLNSVI